MTYKGATRTQGLSQVRLSLGFAFYPLGELLESNATWCWRLWFRSSARAETLGDGRDGLLMGDSAASRHCLLDPIIAAWCNIQIGQGNRDVTTGTAGGGGVEQGAFMVNIMYSVVLRSYPRRRSHDLRSRDYRVSSRWDICVRLCPWTERHWEGEDIVVHHTLPVVPVRSPVIGLWRHSISCL